MVAAVGLGAVVCEACGSPARNGAAGGNELGLLPIGGDDEGDGYVLAIGREKLSLRWVGQEAEKRLCWRWKVGVSGP